MAVLFSRSVTESVELAVMKCSVISALRSCAVGDPRSNHASRSTDISIANVQHTTESGLSGVKLAMLMKRRPLEASEDVRRAFAKVSKVCVHADALQQQARREKMGAKLTYPGSRIIK